MPVKIDDVQFAELCSQHSFNIPAIMSALKTLRPDYGDRRDQIVDRIIRLRKTGLLPLDSGNFVSQGEVLKGTTTLYNESGEIKHQYVKTDVAKEAILATFKECIDNYVEELPKFQPVPCETLNASEDLLVVYPLGDSHVGMKAYKDEVGEGWDLIKTQEVLCGIFDRLVKTAPHCKQAVIVNLGDYFHRDNMAGVTERHRHKLDTDGTYLMMVSTGMKIMVQMINSALEHHETVRVINSLGNHDDTGAIFLQVALAHMYTNEPRVQVDCTSSVFQYFQHGTSFFGVHHGHTVKPDKLPLLMATDRPVEWGTSTFRYFLTGHVHHEARKEYSGCIVESFRTLASKDSYAHTGGWRAGRDSKALVIHKDFGEVERHTVNIAQVLK